MSEGDAETPTPVPQPGDHLPDIELPDLDGRRRRFSTHLGGKLLIFMWASW